MVLQSNGEKNVSKAAIRSVFELDCIPLWGSISICGRRPEMEDATTAVPRFINNPIKMLIGNHVYNGMSQSLTHLTSHFYGIYDGHGGPQVQELKTKMQSSGMPWPDDESEQRWEQAWLAIKKHHSQVPRPVTAQSFKDFSANNIRDTFRVMLKGRFGLGSLHCLQGSEGGQLGEAFISDVIFFAKYDGKLYNVRDLKNKATIGFFTTHALITD